MKILIVDEMHPSLFPMLDEAGLAYRYEPAFKRAHILSHIADYEGLVIRSKTVIDEEVLLQAPRLRFVARAGAGLDLIDLEAIRRRDIQVFAANEGNRDAVAEHAVGMLLGLFAHIVKADREVRQGLWNREGNRGIELMGKTVGLIGYGFNGSATARRLNGFGCRVLAYDKYLVNYGDEYAQESTMEAIMAQADVISLHVPLTSETRLMLNDDFIAAVARPFFLLNIARGEIVQLEAVVRGLESGKVRGAGLDVLENEKLSTLTPEQQKAFDYLRTSPRVILTPHVAGWTQESYAKINEALVKQIMTHIRVNAAH
ncbi:2-hydroxyacid dehydrogenase [Runella slithyformis]|uniref:Phosphoglycerate dehydrogenase n=1 Tax=Runella slithyformis (strain ATCC 29530 / DSM 19594 / LMG 11500 / NCIMB 11436 / LSU 4) TaxID=761193 RepID=A0A7U4E869_RUNSL|nr:2-hydroxyacid dehydrogenase [Runella slithyformis]AEI51393.1 Phosphoglycerate dehydrogenase [Runella slithyformis DSM 19594]